MSWVQVRVPNLDPQKTCTCDTGLTGTTGVAGDCYCHITHITGCSSLVPSISNHVLTSDDHENKDSEREEQRRVGDNDRAGKVHPQFFIFGLYTDYTKTTGLQEAARRVSAPLSFHCHCDVVRRLVPPVIAVAIAPPNGNTGASDHNKHDRQ